ncbi:putative amidase signature enzyme [Lyophyllum shimeji]|uniref:amidase n=1 Tax=Lyophyllum shimeji TaxID=47721 RepID=A0A9P3PNY3_LYOSH|nr:putative amidase signature enzyme [Lyophyllum shimeji]
MLFSYLAHRKACVEKQNERQARIAELPARYKEPIGSKDASILAQSVSSLVESVQSGQTDPSDVLTAYGKEALKAHAETNCLTEIMIQSAETWAKECNRKGPLAGVPVSLKEMVSVAGWDSSIGYSAWIGRPLQKDSPLVRLLRDAGAVPYVKTNVPITLMSGESYSDLFGRTTNPHKKTHSAGGSSGGEGALLAYGGSRIGIGTDVAGSVRIPAHYSGVYSIKASSGRFLRTGNTTGIPGQEGVPPVFSPMARTLEDLETFWKAIFSMKPWEYDHACLVMPWKDFSSEGTFKWGVMWDDGVVFPSPACKRALETVVDALRNYGHEVIDIHPPSPYEGLKIASQLLIADGGRTATQHIRTGESNDAGVAQAVGMASLPRWIKQLYVGYIRYIKRDDLYAGLVEGWHERKVFDYWPLVAQREDYRRRWFEMWQEEKLDFVLTVPNALPAVPHNGMKDGFKALGYTLLFNLLDYTAGVLPITHVHAVKDKLDADWQPRNGIEKAVYRMYDSEAMDGLPVGVQVVGRRLEEEKVLAGMKALEHLLRREGIAYKLLNA